MSIWTLIVFYLLFALPLKWKQINLRFLSAVQPLPSLLILHFSFPSTRVYLICSGEFVLDFGASIVVITVGFCWHNFPNLTSFGNICYLLITCLVLIELSIFCFFDSFIASFLSTEVRVFQFLLLLVFSLIFYCLLFVCIYWNKYVACA